MAGSPLKRMRKAGITDPVIQSLIVLGQTVPHRLNWQCGKGAGGIGLIPYRIDIWMLYALLRVSRAKIRFTFQAIVTSLHSPRTLSSPRSRNCRKPRTDLMMPNTGSGMCLR